MIDWALRQPGTKSSRATIADDNVAGNFRGWRWVNGRSFRIVHLAAIAVVVVQSWLGQLCPLTTLESWLRVRAGSSSYRKSFIEHWVQRVVFYEAPFWVFAWAYVVFGLVVVAAWWYFPPRRNRRDRTVTGRATREDLSGQDG